MKKFLRIFLVFCFIMCLSTITFASNFYDTKGTIYEGIVDRIAGLGIVNGISETAFAPNKGITRGELAKMIVYTKGMQDYADEMDFDPLFSDTKKHWAKDYIEVAVGLGILNGYGDGTFKPDKEVSYAEIIAIIMRMTGYVNIDETSGTTWYSGYVKRMYEIGLADGISEYKSYEASAKRGDVAVLWWNMLISQRWAIHSENTVTGLYYTYSDKTQLEILFPDYEYIQGPVKGISGVPSGELVVTIGDEGYITKSDVPLYALGATASGVYDKENDIMYGFDFDEDLENYKVVSGPLSYLKDLGYKLNSAKKKVSYGSALTANYAYLIVSKTDDTIFRVVYVDASNSIIVDSLEVKHGDEEKDKENKNSNGKVFINEEEIADLYSAIVKNGKYVSWDKMESGYVITELIPGKLYTYDKRTLMGDVTDYSTLNELEIEGDKYIVSDKCIYTLEGEEDEKDSNKEIVHSFKDEMTKPKFKSYLNRGITYYLNAAEEIVKLEIGKYLPDNIEDKYINSEYDFFYISDIRFGQNDDEEKVYVLGNALVKDKEIRYQVKDDDFVKVGSLVVASDLENNVPNEFDSIESSKNFDDIFVVPDFKGEYRNEAFGEYTLLDETMIFKAEIKYGINSNDEVASVNVKEMSSLEELGDLDKYRINLFCDEDMNVEIVLAEKDVNKVDYPIGRVIEIEEVKIKDETGSKKNIEVTVSSPGRVIQKYVMVSGDCEIGELITYDNVIKSSTSKKDKLELLNVKERFRTEFIGYKGDVVVNSFDSKSKTATIVGGENDLNLNSDSFYYNKKLYDLSNYSYIMAKVRKDGITGKWSFTTIDFLEKEHLELEEKDRIAFGELNGIAVVYRGYDE